MSIQQNFPGIMPSLNLNFAKSKRLDPRVTFQRLTGATVTNELGLLERVGNNIPRFDHVYDASTGAVRSLGLLVEEQRENILNQSVVTTSNWTGSTSNTTYSNLSLNALGIFPGVEVTSTTGAAWHRRTTGFNVPFVSGTQYAVTFYYREGTSGRARLQLRYNSQESYVQGPVDGSAWTVQQTLGTVTNVTTTLLDGQSTYKTSYIFTPNFTGVADLGIGVGLEGSAGVTIIALGAQVEVGAFPTSYIPTTGLPTTRAADRATIDGENFSSWYNQVEGTVFTSFRRNTNGSTVRVFNIDDGTNTNRISGLASDVFYQTYVNPAAAGPTATFSETDTYKVASGHQDNNMQVYVNGFYQQANTSITIPKNLNTFRIGNWHNNTFQGTTISQLIYYPRRLTNNQLQQLTR